jgi:hypothetical protein
MKLQKDIELWETAGTNGHSKLTTIKECPYLHYLVHQCWQVRTLKGFLQACHFIQNAAQGPDI